MVVVGVSMSAIAVARLALQSLGTHDMHDEHALPFVAVRVASKLSGERESDEDLSLTPPQ